jgi:hypothetical protein
VNDNVNVSRDLIEGEYRIIQKITDLVVTMLWDDRIPLKIRQEYHQRTKDEKMSLIGFFSNDLAEILSKKQK